MAGIYLEAPGSACDFDESLMLDLDIGGALPHQGGSQAQMAVQQKIITAVPNYPDIRKHGEHSFHDIALPLARCNTLDQHMPSVLQVNEYCIAGCAQRHCERMIYINDSCRKVLLATTMQFPYNKLNKKKQIFFRRTIAILATYFLLKIVLMTAIWWGYGNLE